MMPRGAHRQRGLTMLEVVLASALLVSLSGIVMGTLTFIERVNVRDVHRLNGIEIAHRVIAQYIDDPRELPDEDVPRQQGDFFYRYIMRDDVVIFDGEDLDVQRNARTVPSRSMSAIDQFGNLNHRLIVEVYISDERVPESMRQSPIVKLDRFYSPVVGDESALMDWLTALIERHRQEQREERQRRRDNQ